MSMARKTKIKQCGVSSGRQLHLTLTWYPTTSYQFYNTRVSNINRYCSTFVFKAAGRMLLPFPLVCATVVFRGVGHKFPIPVMCLSRIYGGQVLIFLIIEEFCVP